ncbi:MAG: glycosyltransferase family 4 protein [Patescibacteria group bacterium]
MRDINKKLKIVHIGTADTNGGAAKASYALHKNLLALGHDSKMLVGYKYSADPEIEGVWFNRGIIRRGLYHFLVGKLEEWTGFQYLIQPFRNLFLKHKWVREADIIHLHNLHGNFFSYTIFPKLTKIAPTVWTLYDMWAMSDHCTYPALYGCEIWKTGEGKCPALFDYPPIKRDTGAYLWKRKKEAYEQSKITVVGPSKWMCEMAEKSPLMKNFDIRYIAQGIDEKLYSPVNSKDVRRELKIPEEALVVMVTALKNAQRKGLDYFIDSLKYLKTKPRPWLLVVGNQSLHGLVPPEFKLCETGYLKSEKLLAKYYSAADIFVLPTLADNLPLTIMDSLSCGIPVVSFDVGGVKEMVRHMETGYLAKYKDSEDFARGMDLLLADAEMRVKMGKRGQEIILNEYTIKRQAENYVRLYEQLI